MEVVVDVVIVLLLLVGVDQGRAVTDAVVLAEGMVVVVVVGVGVVVIGIDFIMARVFIRKGCNESISGRERRRERRRHL